MYIHTHTYPIGSVSSENPIFTYHLVWSLSSYMHIDLDPRQRDPQPESVESETSCNYCGNICVWAYFF